MELLIFKEAGIDDIPVIRHIAMVTWPATYGRILSPGQLEYMLAKMYAIQVLKKQMETGQRFILACLGGQPVAFAGYGAIDEPVTTYKLHKLYVMPGIQKAGAGKKLLLEVEERARLSGGIQLILNVNRGNQAKSFYEKMGFSILETVDLDIGNGFKMNDFVMGKEL